ncbi:hypothetical protein ES703_103047 [subsurface metagenome]
MPIDTTLLEFITTGGSNYLPSWDSLLYKLRRLPIADKYQLLILEIVYRLRRLTASMAAHLKVIGNVTSEYQASLS